jgi:hypothetical protein
MNICIAYTQKGAKTGRALFEAIKNKTNHLVRRAFKTSPLPSTDVLIRWGSSCTGSFSKELNSAQGVANASNKGKMMRLLKANTLIQTAPVSMICDGERYDGSPDDYVYVRTTTTMNVEYGKFRDLASRAIYVSKPLINRAHEYRVQVFNGKIVGIYEKKPHQQDTRLFKSWNCHFYKLDPAVCTCREKGQAMAIEAVKTMGLLFGGVDLVKTTDNKYYVIEVNSSPGLNSLNVDKWADMMLEYVRNPVAPPVVQQPVARPVVSSPVVPPPVPQQTRRVSSLRFIP